MRIEVNVETGEVKEYEDYPAPVVDTPPPADTTPPADTITTPTGA